MDSAADSKMDFNQGNYAMRSSFMGKPAHWVLNGKHCLPVPETNLSVSPTPVALGIIPNTNRVMMPYSYMSLTSDPNFNLFYPLNYYEQQVVISPNLNLCAPIVLSNAILTPPPAGIKRNYAPKPNGCQTVYVGGLPEKITESIIKEIFEKCGEINSIRMNSKHFCHVRFMDMESVEKALLLSGYRIKIDNKDDSAYNGKLNVNYAVCHEDQRNYECKQRQVKRLWRHYEKTISPPPVPVFSEYEASSVNEKLRSAETFKEAIQVLTTWLEKGECLKTNCGTFYSILQNTNNLVKRLASEKIKREEEVKKVTENYNEETRRTQLYLSLIQKVYTAAEMQKNWDLFSKSQRRHIEDWKKQSMDLSTDLLTSRVEEDMDLDLDKDRSHSGKVKEKTSYADNYTQCVPCEVDTIENETYVVALILILLLAKPYGVHIGEICSHVVKILPTFAISKIENVMKKFPNLFKEESTEITETIWKFVGFNTSISSLNQ